MRKAIFILSLVLAALLITMVQPRCVWACDCDVPSFADASSGAAAIFAGRVESIASNPRSNVVAVTFAPSTVWKGTLPPTVVVRTSYGTVSCGYEFQEGQEYLVYTRPAFRVGLCSRTQPLADATADLAALGDGQAPTANTAETPQPSVLPNTSGETEAPALNLLTLVMLGALGVVIAGCAGHVLRKRLL